MIRTTPYRERRSGCTYSIHWFRFRTGRFRPYDMLLLLAAMLMVVMYVRTANGGFPLDDSWIHQVYGRNLALTGQWAFVPGVASAASTSPLYTVLLAVGYKLNVPYQLWTHGLGTLALWVTGMIGARMAEQLRPNQKYAGALVGLALVTAWHLTWAAASGMETMLFSLWTLALMGLAWRETGERSPQHALQRGFLFGAASALATLTRPEGVALAGLTSVCMLLARPHNSWRGLFLWATGAGVGFGLFIAPYLALNAQLTGGLLPNTAAAKQAQYAPVVAALPFVTRLWRMVEPLLAGGQLLLLPGIVYVTAMLFRRLRSERQTLLLLLPVLWAFGLIALYAARLPAPFQHGRYVIPALPGLILVGVVGTIDFLNAGRGSVVGRVLSRSLAITSALAFFYFAFVAGLSVYRQDVRIIDEEMVTAARWIADNIPPEERLAVHDIGAVGYFAPRPILDLAGLVSPEIVPFINEEEPLWNWLRDNHARYLMAFPDQIPGDDPTDPRLCPVFITDGATSRSVNGPNMAVYALNWGEGCNQ